MIAPIGASALNDELNQKRTIFNSLPAPLAS
jgi:hypothetical protein